MREGLHIDDWKWPAGGGVFRVVGDNQTMMNILNGKTACDRQDLVQEMEECANRLAEIVLLFGGIPADLTGDWVVWRPREFNKRADEVADFIMDGVQVAEHFGWAGMSWDGSAVNFSLHVDGGARRNGDGRVVAAAAGWVLMVWERRGEVWDGKVAAKGGQRLAGATSFEAEIRVMRLGLRALWNTFAHKRLECCSWLDEREQELLTS